MSKQINPQELSQIVTDLLTRPDAVGELATHSVYSSFMTAIANVVAEHCGGEVQYMASELEGVWYVGVQRNDSLPGGSDGVWSAYDQEADF